jgi:hypothetical protein
MWCETLWHFQSKLRPTSRLTAPASANRWPQYSEVLLLWIMRYLHSSFFLVQNKNQALCSRYSDFPTVSTTDKSYVYSQYRQWIVFFFGASTRAVASNEPHVKSVQGLKLSCSSRLSVAQFLFTLNLKLGHKWLKCHHPNLGRHILFHVVVEVSS